MSLRGSRVIRATEVEALTHPFCARSGWGRRTRSGEGGCCVLLACRDWLDFDASGSRAWPEAGGALWNVHLRGPERRSNALSCGESTSRRRFDFSSASSWPVSGPHLLANQCVHLSRHIVC